MFATISLRSAVYVTLCIVHNAADVSVVVTGAHGAVGCRLSGSGSSPHSTVKDASCSVTSRCIRRLFGPFSLANWPDFTRSWTDLCASPQTRNHLIQNAVIWSRDDPDVLLQLCRSVTTTTTTTTE